MKSVFAINSSLIRRRPKKFYESLLGYLERNCAQGHSSETPHFMERAWVSIFSQTDTNLMLHDVKSYGGL